MARSVSPLFFKVTAGLAYSEYEVCQAAEKAGGTGSVVGAQRIGMLWRLYPTSATARLKILTIGMAIRGIRIDLHNNNPFLIIDNDGNQIPVTKLYIGNIPLSVSDEEIKKGLSKNGVKMRSGMLMEKVRDPEGRMTGWLTGRRTVMIDIPATPLPKFMQILNFRAVLFHKEMKKMGVEVERRVVSTMEEGGGRGGAGRETAMERGWRRGGVEEVRGRTEVGEERRGVSEERDPCVEEGIGEKGMEMENGTDIEDERREMEVERGRRREVEGERGSTGMEEERGKEKTEEGGREGEKRQMGVERDGRGKRVGEEKRKTGPDEERGRTNEEEKLRKTWVEEERDRTDEEEVRRSKGEGRERREVEVKEDRRNYSDVERGRGKTDAERERRTGVMEEKRGEMSDGVGGEESLRVERRERGRQMLKEAKVNRMRTMEDYIVARSTSRKRVVSSGEEINKRGRPESVD